VVGMVLYDIIAIQFNCQHLPIQFPASGARNMGDVRNHTSFYFASIASIASISF
jgi:hypothetical protein